MSENTHLASEQSATPKTDAVAKTIHAVLNTTHTEHTRWVLADFARAQERRIHDLSSALRELLQDTQHVNHNCGDGPDMCPVLNARQVLEEP